MGSGTWENVSVHCMQWRDLTEAARQLSLCRLFNTNVSLRVVFGWIDRRNTDTSNGRRSGFRIVNIRSVAQMTDPFCPIARVHSTHQRALRLSVIYRSTRDNQGMNFPFLSDRFVNAAISARRVPSLVLGSADRLPASLMRWTPLQRNLYSFIVRHTTGRCVMSHTVSINVLTHLVMQLFPKRISA